MQRLRHNLDQYPRQFWLLFAGFLINRSSNSLIWPFLTIYMRRQMDVPLTTITLLFSLQSISGFASTSIVGFLMDRFGRKRLMVAGLFANSVTLILMSAAHTVEQWAVLIALYGAVSQVFDVGGNTMIADIVPPDRRTNAYALTRMGANFGMSMGLAFGGFIVTSSYTLSYYTTAVAYVVLALMTIVFISESLPQQRAGEPRKPARGYLTLLQDRPFITFWVVFILLEMSATMLFRLLSVYGKENFQMPEYEFGWLVSLNGVMVVLFQYSVTQITRRYRHLPVLAVGAAFYAVGVGSVALGHGFRDFAISMVIVTLGELMFAPTSVSLVANMAPPDMRARYMGMYALGYPVGSGIGPVIGGFLNDRLAPVAIWYSGFVLAGLASLSFFAMGRTTRPAPEVTPPPLTSIPENTVP